MEPPIFHFVYHLNLCGPCPCHYCTEKSRTECHTSDVTSGSRFFPSTWQLLPAGNALSNTAVSLLWDEGIHSCAMKDHCRSMLNFDVHWDPQITFCAAAFHLDTSWLVLVPGLAQAQVKYLALLLLELPEIFVSPLLEPVKILDGIKFSGVSATVPDSAYLLRLYSALSSSSLMELLSSTRLSIDSWATPLLIDLQQDYFALDHHPPGLALQLIFISPSCLFIQTVL